jgi:hypothetical protein
MMVRTGLPVQRIHLERQVSVKSLPKWLVLAESLFAPDSGLNGQNVDPCSRGQLAVRGSYPTRNPAETP